MTILQKRRRIRFLERLAQRTVTRVMQDEDVVALFHRECTLPRQVLGHQGTSHVPPPHILHHLLSRLLMPKVILHRPLNLRAQHMQEEFFLQRRSSIHRGRIIILI